MKAMQVYSYRSLAVTWAVLVLLCIALYWPNLHAGYFSDDFLFFFDSPPANLYDYFSKMGAAAHAYRPLEAIILTVIQQHFRFETFPIHLASFCAHSALVCIVAAAARRLRMGVIESFLACTFTFFSQVSETTLLGNDTLSQAASTLFGGLSILLLYSAYVDVSEEQRPTHPHARLALSVASYGVALFFKETALGFFMVAMILAAVTASRQPVWRARLRRALVLSAPFIVMTLTYFLARFHAGGRYSGGGVYRIEFGSNVIRNLAEFSLAAFGPFSTVTGAISFQTHNTRYLVFAALGWTFVVTTLVIGALTSRRKRPSLFLALCAVASLFPTYLLSHVSELYLYNAMPFLALSMGIALASLFRRGRWGQIAAISCAALVIGTQIFADRQKAELMRQNGSRAASMMAAIAQFMKEVPPSGEILLVNTAGRKPEYSVFVLKGFDVLEFGTYKLGPLLGRRDVNVRIMEETDAQKRRPNANVLMLKLAGNAIHPYARSVL
jgi:hypothetical protein